ncbi:methylated-DNA--[protein]-cysteine S-methyltransferase [Ramlibacter sp.]|uniref:methylated-DNA--[protein]-cysteine S-methyltransferase n=1 Tax=Ramlibacter sp. TaxID=1917967 RepID=UPI003D118DE6
MDYLNYASPLGEMIVAATDRGLAGVWFRGQKHGPEIRDWREAPDHPLLKEATRQLDDYFAGHRATFDLPLDLQAGTPFQQSVWQALLAIPSGRTMSYAQIGQCIGKPTASRAVGAAVGRNPLSIVVPCHRVLGAGGSLTGYAGGLDRKTALLRLEGACQGARAAEASTR